MKLEEFKTLDSRGKELPGLALFSDNGKLVHKPTEWLRHLTLHSDLAYSTIHRYAEGVKSLSEYLYQIGPSNGLHGDIDSVLLLATRYHVDQWLRYEREVKGISRSTRRLREAAVKRFYCWTGSEVSDCNNPKHPYSERPEKTTKNSKRIKLQILTEESVRLLLLNLHNECERAMWQLAYDAGLRINELIKLTKGSIDLANELYRRAREQSHYGVAKDVRYIPLNAPTLKKRDGRDGEGILSAVFISTPSLERLVEYHHTAAYELAADWHPNDPQKPAFLTANGKQWKYNNAYKQLVSSRDRAKLQLRVYPHLFRHSSTVSILTSSDHGKTHLDRFFAASVNLRHASFSTTEQYAYMPWDSLFKMGADDSVFNRAKRLKESTHLPERLHRERRGHRD